VRARSHDMGTMAARGFLRVFKSEKIKHSENTNASVLNSEPFCVLNYLNKKLST